MNKKEFVDGVANIVRYAFREQCSLEDLKGLEITFDESIHRQVRFGVYATCLSKKKSEYPIEKYGFGCKEYCVGDRKQIGTSIDFLMCPLVEMNILKGFSLYECKQLATDIKWRAENSQDKFITDEQYKKFIKIFEENDE